MPWVFNVVYLVGLALVSPWLFVRACRRGRIRSGWSQKLWGQVPRNLSTGPTIWIHAVSVGEVLQIKGIVAAIRSRHPEIGLYITTTTRTGLEVARREFSDHSISYCPLDFSWSVQRALRRIRPSLVVLVELELWPNLILATSRQGIPIQLINGRMSSGSHRGYRRIRPLIGNLLRRFHRIGVQTEVYRDRLSDLGAPTECIEVTGSIKFDNARTDRDHPITHQLAEAFAIHPHERVIVVGSTQSPEEDLAIEAWLAVRKVHSDVRLVLVPRHPERFDEVAELVRQRRLGLNRRSDGKRVGDADAVGLLDTVGELPFCWGLADLAFVGGSLSRRGGQNMIEPSALGAAVLFGPNTDNFRDVVDLLVSNQACRVVHSGDELTTCLHELLDDPRQAQDLGQRAQELVLRQRGATQQTVDLIVSAVKTPRSAQLRRHIPAA